VGQIMAREGQNQRSGQNTSARPAQTHARFFPKRPLLNNPEAPGLSQWPPAASSPATNEVLGPLAPQTVGTSFLGAQLSEAGFIPPDSMGAVGPSQVLVIVNGRIKVFDKSSSLGPLNTTTDTFFSSVRSAGTSDPHVRFDRLTKRWFISMIDVATDNRVLIAVSSGPTISGTSSFTFFQFQHDLVGTTPNSDTGGFADYDTLGVDRFALYIGMNVFNSAGTALLGTTGFVINKSNLFSGTLTVTPFRQIGAAGGTGSGPWTPQGVDNDDPNATQGYFIGVDNATFSRLDIRRVSNPGGTPSISGNLTLTVPTTTFPIQQVHKGDTLGKNLDALDDRLFGAAIRRNKITGATTLWTAHNIQVNSSGTGSSSGGRNGSRWYEIGNLTGTPTLVQSGTLFDSASTNPRGFWIPSVSASGQGHMALGCSYAGSNDFAGVATSGRFRTDALGSIQAATLAVVSSTPYNLNESPNPHRWGDFSAVSVDPNDDMTMWTFQEYCSSGNAWGVRAVQLKAPPPVTPSNASPASVAQGQSSVNVVVTGTPASGSEFFDPGPDTGGPGYSNHLAAAVNGGGVTVNSVTFSNPTNITLNVTVAAGATPGARTITVTNPDGQAATSASGILTITTTVTNAPPLIVTQPQDQTVNQGSDATFSVTATGTLPLAYQWRFNGTNIGGATGSAFTRTNAQLADAGSYSVVVTNSFGSDTSSNATLSVITGLGSIPVTGAPYSQNFDSMGPTGTSTPPGWYAGTGTGAVSGTNVTVGTGSDSAGGNYNYGSSGSSDRALGSLASNTGGQRDTQARFINVSGASILSLTIAYTGEQWRVGGNGAVNNDLVLQYSTDGTNFTALGAGFNFSTPVDSGSAGALDGNAAANRVPGIGGTYTPAANITNGGIFYLRWADANDASADNGMAVDDLNISFSLTNPPPPVVADFVAGPTNGLAPLAVSFTNLSSGATSYSWDFGDGNTSTATNPANTYSNAGNYTVTLTAMGAGGTNSLIRSNYVVLTNQPPPVVADFVGDPTNGAAPLTVSFTNLSSGATGYSWDFGDGNTSTAANPANTYSNAGSYTVTLMAMGVGGTNSLTRSNYIVVTNPPPPVLADFVGDPTNGAAPLTVSFTNLSSGATSYSWDFGDGNTSTAANPANTYSNAGSYTVTLTAGGAGGTNSLTRSNYIVVTNPPPPVLADFVGDPTNGAAPLTVSFTNLSSGAASYSWDFGDGNTSTAANPANTYSNAGSYTVTLTAIGAGGTNNLTRSNYVVVTNSSQLVVTPASLDFGLVVTGATAQAAFMVSNAGPGLLIGAAAITPGSFAVVSGSPYLLDASSVTNVVISFSSPTPGVFSNAVLFVSNGGDSTNAVAGRAADTPLLLSPALSGSDFTFSFDTLAGFTYVIEFKDSFDDARWQILQSVAGDGTVKTITVPLADAMQRFYRMSME
jgi:PKD repeat protein